MNKFFLITLLSFLLQASSFAWGPIGHRVVGQIAEFHLTAKAKAEVKKILKHETLAQVSTWADYIKSGLKWRKASSWHYVSIPDGKTYATSDKNPKGDIVEAIARYSKILKNKKAPLKERAIAIKFLVHFLGDIHQPLHVGYKHDRGGNSVKLKWFNNSTNLHTIWDVHLIEMQKLSYIEYTDFINHASNTEVKKWQAQDTLVWTKESMALRPQVYDIVKNAKDYKKYGEYKYNYKNIKTLNLRMLQAGVRLAGLLNSLL